MFTNAQAINWCNTALRPGLDNVVSAVLTAQRILQTWTDQQLYVVIPNDANFIQDGSTVASGTPDGRAPITDAQVNQAINDLNAFATFWAENSWLSQLDAIAVNPRSAV